jgi:hypothetical protein
VPSLRFFVFRHHACTVTNVKPQANNTSPLSRFPTDPIVTGQNINNTVASTHTVDSGKTTLTERILYHTGYVIVTRSVFSPSILLFTSAETNVCVMQVRGNNSIGPNMNSIPPITSIEYPWCVCPFFFLNFCTLSSTCQSDISAHLSKLRDKESRHVAPRAYLANPAELEVVLHQ